MKKRCSSLFRLHRKEIICLIFMSILVGVILATMKFNITPNYEGIFLLKGQDRKNIM